MHQNFNRKALLAVTMGDQIFTCNIMAILEAEENIIEECLTGFISQNQNVTQVIS